MNENLDPTANGYNAEELDLEKRLRPLSFDDFAGQDQKFSFKLRIKGMRRLIIPFFMALQVWEKRPWRIFLPMNCK
jgi:hypothetical protein